VYAIFVFSSACSREIIPIEARTTHHT
jgi:hypothetical protein